MARSDFRSDVANQGVRTIFPEVDPIISFLSCNLSNKFYLDTRAEWNLCDPKRSARMFAFVAKDFYQKLRSAIGDEVLFSE